MDYEKAMVEEMGVCRLIRRVCDEIIVDSVDGMTKDPCELLNRFYSNAVEGKEADLLFTEYSPMIGSEYDNACKYLKYIFLEEDMKETLNEYLFASKNALQNLIFHVNGKNPFPAYRLIEDYLTQYYELLKSVLRISDKLKDVKDIGSKFLQSILNVGFVFSEDNLSEYSYASLYAPAVLNGVARLYSALIEYGKCAAEIKQEKIRKNYQEVLISKVLRYFNWFIVQDKKVMRLEMPAVLYGKESMRWTLNIPVYPLENCNSYEGIGEVRLLDKVIYEIERLKREEKLCNLYNIVVVGDIESRPMDQLCKLVKCFLREKGLEDFRVNFKVLTYNKDAYEHSDDMVTYEFERYDRNLLRSDKLNNLLDQSDLIFLLDCCDLYNELGVEVRDKNFIWQKVAEDDYKKDYLDYARRKDYVRKGGFAELIEELYIFNYSGEFGKWKKRLNTSMLCYLCSYCSERQNVEKSIYAYISDMEAFEGFNYKEQQIIRIENYNDKQVAIIKISDYEEEKLDATDRRKLIVFTVWQLIKHIAIRNIDEFLAYFRLPVDEARSKILLLRQVLIGVDYSEWPRSLKFYYQWPEGMTDDEKFDKQLRECIENEMMPFFKDGVQNMFSEYFIKSFSSFLYSDAKNVNDMLFLHLFKNCHSVLKEVSLEGETRQKGTAGEKLDLSEYQNQKCKYSQKQYYYEMMKDYDTSSDNFTGKYIKLMRLEKSEPELGKEIFANIKRACEENSYTDSYLYRKFAKGCS